MLPPNPTRRCPWDHDRQLYRLRNPVERLFCRLKAWRRTYTRCDKLNMMFASCITTELIAEVIAESLRSRGQALTCQLAATDNVQMEMLIHHVRRICTALVGAAAVMVTMAIADGPAAASRVQTKVHALDGHRVTLDVYPAAGPLRGAAILSHGFTRSRRTLAGHAQALADAGVLVLTPDLPCTFDFRCNARALAALVDSLRAGGAFGVPVERVMLVGFSAGGLSSLLAADTPGVVGYVGLDPFDRVMSGEAERLGLAAAGRLKTEALLLRAPPSSCNAQAVAAPWGTALPGLWRDELITGASHCDFESPTDWMCRLACGATDPARQERVRQGLLNAAARWMR